MSVSDLAVKYNCTYCQEEISGVRVRCAECKDFNFCLQCFSLGAEIGPHKKDHPYEFMESRVEILKKATEYIRFMKQKNNAHQQDIDDLQRQNTILETKIRALEKARATGNYKDVQELILEIKSEGRPHDTDSSDGED